MCINELAQPAPEESRESLHGGRNVLGDPVILVYLRDNLWLRYY